MPLPLLALPTEILEIIAHSLESQADINALIRTNRRLYHIAHNYLYKINASFFKGSALVWAVIHNQLQTAHYALQNGVTDLLNWDRGPLVFSAEKGHKEMVSLLLKYGASVESRHMLNEQTPLYVAAAKGHEDVVRLLLENSANLESNNWEFDEDIETPSLVTSDNTPLHTAAFHGHAAVIKLLLEKGANIEAENSRGATPIKRALNGGQYAVFWLLRDNGACEWGRYTAEMILYDAVYDHHVEIVEGLLERGVNPDSCNESGISALTGAALDQNRLMVGLLLEKGANLEAKYEDGSTALSNCAQLGREKGVEILLNCGADPNTRDTLGNTPLHWTVEEDIAKLLLARGAIVDALNHEGETPLSRAMERGDDSMKQVLLQYIVDKNRTPQAV